MVLSIIVILIVGLIAYYHLTQGFFSAGLSAIICVFAALVALGFHESMVDAMLAGRFADQGHAIALMVIFAATYSILRFVFDSFVPGNLRFPVGIDKIGAGLCGLVAGLFVAGLIAVAAQSLPFGPWVGGHARYEVEENLNAVLTVQGKSQQQDMTYDRLKGDKFLNDEPQKLLLPADDIVLGILNTVTEDKASLSSGKPFADAHPNYLQELFGQRVGIQLASKHVALKGKVDVKGVYIARSFPRQFDQERWKVGGTAPIGTRATAPKLADSRSTNKAFLIVRAELHGDLRDKTELVSFSPASVRLKVGRTNYYPIGTLQGPTTLFVAEPDDYLFVPGGNHVDLVFEVDRDALSGTKVASDVLFEFKRLGRVDIGGQDVKPIALAPPPGENVGVVRREGILPKKPDGNIEQPNQPTPEQPLATDLPIDFRSSASWSTDAKLPFPVATGSVNPNETESITPSGMPYSLQNGKFVMLDLIPPKDMKLDQITAGAGQVTELGAPQGKRVLYVWGRPVNGWDWVGSVNGFSVTDKAGAKAEVAGFVVKGKAGDQDTMVVQYKPAMPFTPDKAAGITPAEVGLVFHITEGQAADKLEFNGQLVRSLSN